MARHATSATLCLEDERTCSALPALQRCIRLTLSPILRTGAALCLSLPQRASLDTAGLLDSRGIQALECVHICGSIARKEAGAQLAVLIQSMQQCRAAGKGPLARRQERRSTARALAAGANGWHVAAEAEARQQREEAARRRIEALRSHDVTAYTELLREANSERLQGILAQTDACLQRLCGKLGMAGGSAGESSTAWQALAERVPAAIDVQPSMLQAGQLHDYQMHGLRWLVGLHDRSLNGILADEMVCGQIALLYVRLCHTNGIYIGCALNSGD